MYSLVSNFSSLSILLKKKVKPKSRSLLLVRFSGCDQLSDPTNGAVLIEYKSNGKDKATYSCNSGYTLKGNQNRNCVNGEWTGQEPTCELSTKTI